MEEVEEKLDEVDLDSYATEEYVNDAIENVKGNIGDFKVIIDVVELPIENVREDCFYRLLSGSLVYSQYVFNTYAVHCVETLPETGLPAINIDQTEGNVYYSVSDDEVYGYVDDILSVGLGVPAGWYSGATLLGALGYEYAGVITNILDDPSDGKFRLLLEYVIYDHKSGNWASHKKIGRAGTGASAETFNHPTNVASGVASHAEGIQTTASGDQSHAEGFYSRAKGDNSHAEGYSSHAEGDSSHAEGYSSHAEGSYSHAEGDSSYATGRSQHVQGEFNIVDPQYDPRIPGNRAKYAHIVGNGAADNSRSNAHTLDWEGNAWYQGDVYVGSNSGTNMDDGSKKLATEEYVNNTAPTHSWNGTTLTITSASGTSSANLKGEKGDKGDSVKGDTGPAGVGVSSVKQTTTSTADAGSNVMTVTLSNGATSTFTVKNGSKGSNGADGKTPIKGSDYWTPADQEAIVQQVIEELPEYAEEYSVWENIQFDVVIGAALTTGRYENPLSSAKYAEVPVGGYTQLKVTGWQYGASYGYALCAFFTEKQELISAIKLTDGTQYTNYLVEVPANAFTVVVNGLVGNAMALTGLKVFDCKVLAEEKANRIAKWVTPAISIKQGYIIAQSGTEEQANGNGEIGVVDVSAYKKVIVTGWQYGISYGYKLCYFYGADGQVLSSHQGTVESKKTVLTLDVPNGAVTLKVNGNKYDGNVSVSAYEVFDVADLYNALRPSGKKLITLGDSITALGTGDTGWIKYFIEKTNCELVANVAVNGAWLMDKAGTIYDGNPVFNGADDNANNVLGNQVQKILNNNYPAPDIIMIAIGTNAGISISKEQIRAAYYDNSNALIPLSDVDRTTDAGAYRWCLEKLHEAYPNATIFWCTPILGHQAIRSADGIMNFAESLRIATEYTGQIMIDTIRCGINGVNEISGANGEFLVDGLHPNANGAKKIGYYNASKVLPYLGNLC